MDRKSKKERLQWLADEVGRLMGTGLKVKGKADAMLVVSVDEDGNETGYPFGHVRLPAAEVISGLRFTAMALRRTAVSA